MSLSSDFYNEQQKKKTPSQVATGVNNGTSASSQFLDSVNKGAFKLVVSAAATTTKPTVTPTQKPNIFQSAVDSIKKIADTAIAGLTGQNKQQPVVAPIEKTTPTTQPISSEIKNLPLAGMGTQSIFSSQKNVFDNIPSPSATFKNPLSSNPKAPVSQITQTITNAISSNLPVTSDLFSQLTSEPDIHKAIGNAWSTYSGSILNEAQAMRKYMDTYTNPKSSEIAKVGSNLELISGTAGVFFAPISALFSAAVDIPVVAPTARLINIAFSALGEGATVISNKIVDELPISAKDKAQIKPGLGEIFALAAQIGVGTVIGLKTKDTLTEKYGTTDANTIIDQAKTMAQAENQALVQRVVNGTGSLQDIATYKKLAASGKLREFTQSGHGGYLPSEVGQNVVFTPEQLTSHIEGTDLKGTPLAKEIDSVIKVAQDSNKSIQVITNPPSGIDTFKNPTPQGNKLGYVLTQPVKITLLSEQGGAASRTEVVPQVAPVANAGLYDTGKTPESALMQVGKYANNDYNKITSQVTKDLGYVDEQGVKRINGIERAKEIDKRVAENVNNQRQAENDLYHSLQPQYKIGDTVRMQHVSQPGSYSIVKQGVDGKFTEVPNKLEIGKPIEVKITQARFDTQQSLGQLNRTDFPSSFKLSTLEGKNVKTGESIEIYPRYLVNGKPLQDTIKIKSEDILSKMLKQGKLGSSSNESRVPQPTTPPSPTKVVAKTQAQKTTPQIGRAHV